MFIKKKEIIKRLCFMEDSLDAIALEHDTMNRKLKALEKKLKEKEKK